MSRYIPFNEDDVCDRCGKKGAYDFMGDCFCPDCLEADEDGNVCVKKDRDK